MVIYKANYGMICVMKEKEIIVNIKKEINEHIGKIMNFNIQNYSTNGSLIYNNKKCFFKVVDKTSFIKEINGYLISHSYIPVKDIIYTSFLENCNKYIILYDYDDTVASNSGLLNDLLVKNDTIKKISKLDQRRIEKVLKVYRNIYSNPVIITDECPNDIFFYDRIDTRLKKWYFKLINCNKKIQINNFKSNIYLSDILQETIDYFSKKGIKREAVITQGDPNTLNISMKPVFFDLVTAGYNSIISELSITIVSTLLYDNYFCPKYHSNSYGKHIQAIYNCNLFSPDIFVKESSKTIKINSNILTSYIRKKYILKYINILKKKNINISSDIKYFIIMRLLCVFDINKMSSNDYYYSIFLVCYFYLKMDDDFYKSINLIINEMESIVYDK